ncbi:MAG: hypothetical protein Q8Q41_02575 [bacterium]|nr:hypothetical protein [bacterium]
MATKIRVVAVSRNEAKVPVSVLLAFEEIEMVFRKVNGRPDEVSRVFHGKGGDHDRWIPGGLYLRFIRTAWGVFKSGPARKKKEKPMQRTLTFALAALVLILAFAAPVLAQDVKAVDMPPCLPQEVMEGKVKVGKHDHAYLIILGVQPSWEVPLAVMVEDDEAGLKGRVLPANLGLEKDCAREIHTHENDGLLHIESVEPFKEHALAQVFALFGHPEFLTDKKNGRKTVVVADGQVVAEPTKFVLWDRMKILVILPY